MFNQFTNHLMDIMTVVDNRGVTGRGDRDGEVGSSLHRESSTGGDLDQGWGGTGQLEVEQYFHLHQINLSSQSGEHTITPDSPDSPPDMSKYVRRKDGAPWSWSTARPQWPENIGWWWWACLVFICHKMSFIVLNVWPNFSTIITMRPGLAFGFRPDLLEVGCCTSTQGRGQPNIDHS